jgi:hypothetical protein
MRGSELHTHTHMHMHVHIHTHTHTHTRMHTQEKEPQQCQPSQLIIIISHLATLCRCDQKCLCVWDLSKQLTVCHCSRQQFTACITKHFIRFYKETHMQKHALYTAHAKSALVLPDTPAQPWSYWCVTSRSLLHLWCLNTFKQGLKVYLLTVLSSLTCGKQLHFRSANFNTTAAMTAIVVSTEGWYTFVTLYMKLINQKSETLNCSLCFVSCSNTCDTIVTNSIHSTVAMCMIYCHW